MLKYFDGYKPQITIQQFFTNGFGECKILLCVELIQKMRVKHKELLAQQQGTKKSGTPSQKSAEQPQRKIYSLTEQEDIPAPQQRPLVVKHEEVPEMQIHQNKSAFFENPQRSPEPIVQE